jgi:hypothetical protein
MSRHIGIGSIGLGLVERCLDDGYLRIIGDDEMWNTPYRLECVRVRSDPIGEVLAPARLRIREVGRAHHRDEDVCITYLAGLPVDEHRNGVAGIIDEQLLAAHMALAHGDGELRLEILIQLTVPRIPIALRVTRDVLLPENHQRDMLALQLLMNGCPIRLDAAPPVGLPRCGNDK